jgi:hypothetical protein
MELSPAAAAATGTTRHRGARPDEEDAAWRVCACLELSKAGGGGGGMSTTMRCGTCACARRRACGGGDPAPLRCVPALPGR